MTAEIIPYDVFASRRAAQMRNRRLPEWEASGVDWIDMARSIARHARMTDTTRAYQEAVDEISDIYDVACGVDEVLDLECEMREMHAAALERDIAREVRRRPENIYAFALHGYGKAP